MPEPVYEGPVVNGDVMTDADRARVELAMVFRSAVMHGFHEGIDNHFSLAVPGEPGRFLLNPYGPHWSELRASDLLVVDEAGNVIGDGEAEASAFFIHSRLHLAHPDAACVLHTHMPYATALALTETGFETRLSQNSVRFSPAIAAEGSRFFGQRSVQDCVEWQEWQPASPATASSRSARPPSRTSFTSVQARFSAAGPR